MAETWKKLAFEDDCVLKSLFDADTFLYATDDNTPVATSPANVLAALTGHAAAGFDFNAQTVTVGSLLIGDAANIGSASDPDAIAIAAGGEVTLSQTLILSDVVNAGEDVDKFLVLDGSNNVDYRTGAEVLSDIGALGAHALLDGSTNNDTVAQDVTRGSIIYGNSTPAWDELTIGAADTFLGSDGTDVSYRTAAQVMASLSEECGA